ncbi:MAG: YbjN domain-containing protein [Clostridia bacterium]|nr:YbjN domain-containing protein [Clostridia bacterium]
MVSKYKKAYMAYMDRVGIKYTDSGEDRVRVVYNAENLKSITVNVLFDKDGEDMVAFRAWGIVKVPENKYGAAVLACNKLNTQYRWVKFVVDKDNDLNCEMDAYVDIESVGSECKRCVSRIVNISDEAYPEIMKAIWA